MPSYVCLVLVVIATQATLGHALTSWSYYNSLIVLSSFLAVLALGQGTVILTGGLDLSAPWTIGLSGILLAGLVKGSDAALLYALPIALLVGLAVGFVNGAGIVLLGVSPIVMTLAVNGILQGAALVYSNGTPDGFSSPLLRRFMTGPRVRASRRSSCSSPCSSSSPFCCSAARRSAAASMRSATASGSRRFPASRSARR